MADFKRSTLVLNTGNTDKTFQEAALPSVNHLKLVKAMHPIYFLVQIISLQRKNQILSLFPYHLTTEEMMELADYNMQHWMDLKENIRKHGIESVKVFNHEAGH